MVIPALIMDDATFGKATGESFRILRLFGGQVGHNRLGQVESHGNLLVRLHIQECRTILIKWEVRTKRYVMETVMDKRYTPTSAAADVEAALRLLEGRWKLVILFHLFGGKVLRYSDLEKAIPASLRRCWDSNSGVWRQTECRANGLSSGAAQSRVQAHRMGTVTVSCSRCDSEVGG